ncbi:hypothetical protein VT03_21220 [Planctomyces sp. SH-PL14]|nr:hypothetical protein VT03_21220 [Planctomyces sp. SH-PL14]
MLCPYCHAPTRVVYGNDDADTKGLTEYDRCRVCTTPSCPLQAYTTEKWVSYDIKRVKKRVPDSTGGLSLFDKELYRLKTSST